MENHGKKKHIAQASASHPATQTHIRSLMNHHTVIIILYMQYVYIEREIVTQNYNGQKVPLMDLKNLYVLLASHPQHQRSSNAYQIKKKF